ncbi:MAG: putative metal-binding motif-containing protein [Myxococcota bacterium]|nr:putative metal-binding motif-containing protein [Myxococcota bacterium]
MSEDAGDCDDENSDVYLGADELEDDLDNDCDDLVDEDFEDLDGDGYTTADGDCDDEDGWVNPGLEEFCDLVDNNCDGQVDEDCPVVESTEVKGSNEQCGCGLVPDRSPAPWWILGLLGGILRRRSDGELE